MLNSLIFIWMFSRNILQLAIGELLNNHNLVEGYSFPVSVKTTNNLFIYLFIYLFFQRLFIFGTERDRAWTGEGQRERETQNPKQAPGSEPSAQSLTRGLNSRAARSWPGWSRTLSRLCHPGAPVLISSAVQSKLQKSQVFFFVWQSMKCSLCQMIFFKARQSSFSSGKRKIQQDLQGWEAMLTRGAFS